jgi:ketosteroid isomerase-like protein
VDGAADAVEVVRRWFAELERGNPAPELCDPEIEIRNWDDAPITGPYFGHEGVRQWWEDVADAFDDVNFELLEIEPIDAIRCLTIQRLRGRFRRTGIEVDGAWAAITTIRGDKILSAQGYASPGQARKAVAAQ